MHAAYQQRLPCPPRALVASRCAQPAVSTTMPSHCGLARFRSGHVEITTLRRRDHRYGERGEQHGAHEPRIIPSTSVSGHCKQRSARLTPPPAPRGLHRAVTSGERRLPTARPPGSRPAALNHRQNRSAQQPHRPMPPIAAPFSPTGELRCNSPAMSLSCAHHISTSMICRLSTSRRASQHHRAFGAAHPRMASQPTARRAISRALDPPR